MKKIIGIVLTVVLLLSTLAGLSACGGKEDANTFSYFLYQGNNKYDTSYTQNTQLDWWAAQEWLGEKINLKIMIPSKSSSATETMSTLIASGDYPDIIDYDAIATMTYEELFREEIIMDISPYVEQYMPNYTKYVSENPDIAGVATRTIDGEKKYLALFTFDDVAQQNAWGLSYRRDWILKYGKNPTTGESFTGGYGENGEWSDDIVFPNGTNLPLYISDWEWMFEIFTLAIKNLGLENDDNSYCMSTIYSGADSISGIPGAFNVNLSFYVDNDGYARYGLLEDNAKVYYEAMNNWYKKGWLDKAFNERSADLPYKINMSSVAAGKVGAWYGQHAFFGTTINDPDSPYTDGAYVMGARAPLNDVYGKGTSACWNKDTNNFYNNYLYCYSRIVRSFVVSVNAGKKNLPALFTMLDSIYTEEGAYVHSYGFTKEQQEIYRNQLLIDNGLEESYHFAVDDKGNQLYNKDGLKMIEYHDKLQYDSTLEQCTHGQRLFGRDLSSLRYDDRPEYLDISYKELMNFIPAGGYIQDNIIGLFTPDEQKVYADVGTYTRNEGEQILYKFITGELDAYNEQDWKMWTDLLNARYKNGKSYVELIDDTLTAINKINGK